MPPAPQRYLFDVSFDAPDRLPGPGKEPPPAHYARADLDAARAEGYEAGRTEALAAAATASEQRIAAALAAIDRGIAEMLGALDARAHQTQADAIAILRTVLQKAVPALCRKDPLAELEAMVSESLGELLDEPRLVLRVSDALFDAVQQRISGLAQSAGYAGKIVLLADAALADGDGRIEWADGGAERDTRRIAQDIDACLARALAAPAPRPPAEETING
jgi:flagellar assembly protein FliH